MQPLQSENSVKKPDSKRWLNAKTTVFVKPKSKRERNRYIKKGTEDAKRGVIGFHEDKERNVIENHFINEQVQLANKKIEDIWESCGYDLKEIKAYLDYCQEEFDNLLLELPSLREQKKIIEDDVRSVDAKADKEMSAAVANNRVERRVGIATNDVSERINYVKKSIKSIIKNCSGPLKDLENREALAVSNEEKVIHELNEISSLFMQGTWKEYKNKRFDAVPPETTKLPKQRHFEYFNRYCFNVREREQYLLSKNLNVDQEIGL